MQITWDEVDNTEEPGQYPWHDGVVLIDHTTIAIWKQHPSAVFNLTPFKAATGPKRYVPGSWDAED